MKTATVALLGSLTVAAPAGATELPRQAIAPISVAPTDKAVPAEPASKLDQAGKPRPDVGHRFEPPRGRTCFGQAETRDKIAAHRLAEPFRALRAGRLQGEALRAKLCRWKPDEFVYEVSVLRRDGRVTHVYMNAQSGQQVGATNEPDRN